MMPNLCYPYLCNTTPLLCRHMALLHWCPCLGGWTLLPNLACSRRADNGKQHKIRELFFNVLLKYAIWMSPTEYDLQYPVSRGDFFCNFHRDVKSILYLAYNGPILYCTCKSSIIWIKRERSTFCLKKAQSSKHPFFWYEHNYNTIAIIFIMIITIIIVVIIITIIYHAEDWGFSARNELRVLYSILFNEMEINNLLKIKLHKHMHLTECLSTMALQQIKQKLCCVSINDIIFKQISSQLSTKSSDLYTRTHLHSLHNII